MTLHASDPSQAAGRTIVAGFPGPQAGPDLIEAVAGGELGGVILFTRNFESPEQLADLVRTLVDRAPWPLLVAVDQEGGSVQRLRAPFTEVPEMAALGARGDEALAHRVGRLLADELSAVGVSWNLAPVLDVDTNPANPVIGRRAFGRDPALVARLGVALARGLEQGGVLSCGKHFPGHGDTSQDSHHELPVLRHTLDRLRAVELVPFAAYARAGLASLMTAHVLYPLLDDEHPATLSPAVLRSLRREIAFEGLFVSDALEMKAVADRYSLAEMIERGLSASIDIFLVCEDLGQARAASAHARRLAEGSLRPELAAALRRIDAACRRFGLPRRPAPPARIRAIVGSAEHRRVVREIGG